MDIPPQNQFVSLDKLEAYIERYPEDAGKWMEFLDIEKKGMYPYKPRVADELLDMERMRRHTDEIEESGNPITHFSEGCLFCKKSWTQTNEVPSITLICGHKFHTVCFMYRQYDEEISQCIVEGCDINTWDYIRQIKKTNTKNQVSAEDILFEATEKRPEFKVDLGEFKVLIKDMTKAHKAVRDSINTAGKEVVHKHIFSINEIQKDMNDMVKNIENTEDMAVYRSKLRTYRHKARHFFTKYHLSFRDLKKRGKVNASWRMRWILERHSSSFNYNRLGFRLSPGKRWWKDPLENHVPETDVAPEN